MYYIMTENKFIPQRTILWPFFIDLALLWLRTVKKTFKALQLWFCDQIWISRRRNKYNNFIFQWSKLEKHRIPVIEGSAVVRDWRTCPPSTLAIDRSEIKSTCVSLETIVNLDGGDVSQMVNPCTAFNDRYTMCF